MPFWQVVVALEAVTVVGATVLYALSAWAGRRLVLRWGRYVGITPERLRLAERWVRQRGMRAVIVGRLVPGLRNLTPIAAGVLSVPPRIFIPAMSLGALVYVVILAGAGYVCGVPLLDWLDAHFGAAIGV